MTDQPHRYFFVHIMKTAGGSLRERLIDHFGEAAVYPTRGVDGTDVEPYVLVDRLRERLQARGSQIRVITGHFPLSAAELIDGRVTTLTLLRDPVERTLSYLRQEREDHLIRFVERRAQRASRHAGRPLQEIYDDLYGLAQTHNNMTRMFSLTPPEMLASMRTRVEVGHDHLERAKEALAGVDAVGLQERFEDFCDELSARFGWRLGESRIVNASAQVEVSESFRARLAEDNALDVELYEFAKRLCAAGASYPGGEASTT
jgi:hypothetical protein